MADPIELLVLDIDGVLTDGSVTLTDTGESSQTIHTQDGCALKTWLQLGRQAAILSGRKNEHVADRARQLGISWVRTGVDDKRADFEHLLQSLGCPAQAAAYVGDDLPDLVPMRLCGLPIAVANAVPTVKRAALYVTRRSGGHGAVAEAIELLLRRNQQWADAIAQGG